MKYRKKPIEVEALFLKDFCDVNDIFMDHVQLNIYAGCETLKCFTKSGEIEVSFPAWVILEADGKGCYPVSPEMFERLYEKVEE